MKKGQSVVEALIAVSILTVGFLGILTLLSKSFFLSQLTADQLKATYLAAEGIEVAKNIIDNDLYGGNTWGTCGGICAALNGSYILDPTTGTGFPNEDQPLVAGACPGPALRFDPSAGSYKTNVGSVTTNFKRCVQINHPPSGNEVVVSSIVSWSTSPANFQSVNLEDHFYKWHPKALP